MPGTFPATRRTSFGTQAGEGYVPGGDRIGQDVGGNPSPEDVYLECFFYLTDFSSDLRELRFAARYID